MEWLFQIKVAVVYNVLSSILQLFYLFDCFVIMASLLTKHIIYKFQHTFIWITHTDVKRSYLKKYLSRLHYFPDVNDLRFQNTLAVSKFPDNRGPSRDARRQFRDGWHPYYGGGYSAYQMLNVDETGLFWKRRPNRTYIAKEEKSAPGHKVSKERLTLLLGGNAAGSSN